tara:strand:- start:285 stop:476 length:192 start_codon:yes stop_codon:yes gene_type:complete
MWRYCTSNGNGSNGSNGNGSNGPVHAVVGGYKELNYMNQNRLVDTSLLGSGNPDILYLSRIIG